MSEDSGLGLESISQLEKGNWTCQPDEPANYSEVIALYTTSRSNGIPSVTGLEGHRLPWGHIFELFPGRTPGAVQLRYYTMSHKENSTPSS
ncbi:hypothetical protein ETB97_009222 [Aspergillus alliaceus]|uniref:Uncharacterized protein n=1 Tax=Petromyces alliaceus TaxID=209559 RepID=A0A8H6E130_PETAA|nr:hypothetical protein ETB97_009222 [Aspergillus burnettii]